ncbi:hypothetical protein [Nocardia sp. NPDC051570]|uniref:hypothetical protein n=1 Tax=Nocardia sp. NPDC051570 TaxID=3364324 RepID=UPI00379DF580
MYRKLVTFFLVVFVGSGCASSGAPDPGTTENLDISEFDTDEPHDIPRSPGFGKHTVPDFIVSGGPPMLTDDEVRVPAAGSSWLVGSDLVESVPPSPMTWPRLAAAPARFRIDNPAIPILVRWFTYPMPDTPETLDDDHDSFETCVFATKEKQITPDGKCFYWKTRATIGMYLPLRNDRYNIVVASWPQARDESGQVHDETVDSFWTFSR